MSSAKQFLLSLVATTISIILTFGTAAVVDHNKKENVKKAMVMMVVSDIDKTIGLLQDADSSLNKLMYLQQELALHPDRFNSLRFNVPAALNWVSQEFSETTERIFSTSIETFNTIGDVNFVNEVSSFYLDRHKYKEIVLDKLRADMDKEPMVQSFESLMAVSFSDYTLDNWMILQEMIKHRDKCMQMMKVSEKDLIKFNKQKNLEDENIEDDASYMEKVKECVNCSNVINQALGKDKD